MQVPKEKVRKRILNAGLEEFLVAGYKDSSMRNIAKQAGITVGNIYAYFSSKDDLFENIVGPVVEKLNNLVFMEVPDPQSMTVSQFTEAITTVFLANRSQFLILMNGSAGSRYENIRENLTALVRQRLISDLLPQMPQEARDPLLADTLAAAVIEGILNIFHKYGGDKARLELLIDEFLKILFSDISSRL